MVGAIGFIGSGTGGESAAIPVVPQLTATPTTATVATTAASGTLLYNIGNVPSGVTPTVTPNDGRFAIAGSQAAGWKVVRGLSAVTAGTVNVVAAAVGATSVSVPVTITAGYAFPALSSAKMDGDSRTDNMGAYLVASTTAGYGAANSSAGFIQAVIGNKWLFGQGYQHAIGASTTEAMMYRAQSLSIATTGNPAAAVTGGAAGDPNYSRDSDGATSVLTQPGGLVVSASMSVNDTNAYFDVATGSGHPNTTAIHSLENIGTYVDNLNTAGKAILIGNEYPRGRAAYQLEAKTVSGQTVTATTTLGFIPGDTYGAPGVIGIFASGRPKVLTKVASAPAQDQYSVSSAGVYTFGGTAPTSAWLTYTAQASAIATGDRQRIVKAWCESTAASFVNPITGVDCKLPGLKTRPNVILSDTFNALLDTSSGATQLPLPGTGDILHLHHNQLGALKTAKAHKAAFDVAYPGAASLEQRPTRNNWWAAKGTGAGTTFSGTLPPSMRVVTPTLVSIAGVVLGKVDTTTGAISGTGIVSGSLNFSTGAWTITLDAASRMVANAQLWFEQDIGNYNTTTMAEGTIGRNLIMNALLDMTAPVGTNLSIFSGTSTITGVAATQVPYGMAIASAALNTAIANGTAAVAVSSVTTADGYPQFCIDLDGTHTASIGFGISITLNSPSGRLSAGDWLSTGARIVYSNHPTVGYLYGTPGFENKGQVQTAAVNRPSSTGTQSVTILSARTLDGSTTANAGLTVDSSLLTEWGGPLDLYRLTTLLDTTGCVFTGVSYLANINTSPNVPFAGRFSLGQLQMRRRNDIAV